VRRAAWLLALVASTTASAQVTLEQMLDAADKSNVDRRQAAEVRRRSEAEFRQAWTGFIPSVTATGAYVHNEFPTLLNFGGQTITIVPSDQLDGVVRIEVPLIDVARWYRAAATGAAEDGSAEREELTRDQVRRQVVGNWYSYVGALALRESAKKSLAAAEAQARLQEIRLNAGAATEIERLRANAERARNQQQLSDAENLVAVGRRTLRTLAFLDPGEDATLPQDDFTPAPALEELEGRIGELPAVQAAEKDILVNERLLTAQRLSVLPTLNGNLTERVTNATGFAGRTGSFSAGLNLTWRLDVPTFMGMQVQSASLSIVELAAERTRLQAKDQINTDWQRQKAAVQKVVSAGAQVEAAQRAASVARDRYAVGASTQLDVILAERDVFSAEFGQIQARTDLASARIGLKISAALPLFGGAPAAP